MAFCALKHTLSSYKPAIFMGSGLSFDVSSELFRGGGVTLAAGIGRARVENSGVWGRRLKRAELQTERDGGLSLIHI